MFVDVKDPLDQKIPHVWLSKKTLSYRVLINENVQCIPSFLVKIQYFLAPIQNLFCLNLISELAITLAKSALFS